MQWQYGKTKLNKKEIKKEKKTAKADNILTLKQAVTVTQRGEGKKWETIY